MTKPATQFHTLIAAFTALLSPAAARPHLTTIYNFANAGIGCYPNAGLRGSPNGTFYGATGYCGDGTVFELTPPAAPGGTWTAVILHSFSGNDGDLPDSSLAIDSHGALYGTTSLGGTASPIALGTVFQLTPPASPGGVWTDTVLQTFNNVDGDTPNGGVVIGNDGAIYGTTLYGGGPTNKGTVFQLAPPASPGGAWTETILHSFTGGADGSYPRVGLVIGRNGALYGATSSGGSSTACGGFGCGTVFELTPPASPGGAWTETLLYSFSDQNGDGEYPVSDLLMDAHGVLYGTTSSGGSAPTGCSGYGCGTVFQLAPPVSPGAPWTETVLYSFTGQNGDGANPAAGLTLNKDRILYGTTSQGGASPGCHSYGCGTVFKLTPPAAPGDVWTETVLHKFIGADGAYPAGVLVLDKKGLLYGTTTYGGTATCTANVIPGCGTVFQLKP